MELLYNEFKEIANIAGVTESRLIELFGKEINLFEVDPEEDISWRTFEEPLSKNYLTLLNDNPTAVFKKINKRAVQQSYNLFYDPSKEIILLVGKSENHTLRVETFSNLDEFEYFLLDPYLMQSSIGLDHSAIEHLSSEAIRTFAMLVELFIEKYPNPDINWEPDELLIFTVNSLMSIQDDSKQRLGSNTWWPHFRRLEYLSNLTSDEVALGIQELLIQEHIGFFEEINDEEVYFIGEDLTWFLRGLVWWDKGFLVESNDTQFLFFGNSSPFVMVGQRDYDYSLYNVSGKESKTMMYKYMSFILEKEGQTNQDTSTVKPAINFCGNCGYKLTEPARFCPECGHPLL